MGTGVNSAVLNNKECDVVNIQNQDGSAVQEETKDSTNKVLNHSLFPDIVFSTEMDIKDFAKRIENFHGLIDLEKVSSVDDLNSFTRLIGDMLAYIIARKDEIIHSSHNILTDIKIGFRSIQEIIEIMQIDDSLKARLINNSKGDASHLFDEITNKIYNLHNLIKGGYYCFIPPECESRKIPEELKTSEIIAFIKTYTPERYGKEDCTKNYQRIRGICNNIQNDNECLDKLDVYQLYELSLNIDLLIKEIELALNEEKIKEASLRVGLKIMVQNKNSYLKNISKKANSKAFSSKFSIGDYEKQIGELPNYSENELIENEEFFGLFLNGFKKISIDLLYNKDNIDALDKDILSRLKTCLKTIFEKLEKVENKTENQKIRYNASRIGSNHLKAIVVH